MRTSDKPFVGGWSRNVDLIDSGLKLAQSVHTVPTADFVRGMKMDTTTNSWMFSHVVADSYYTHNFVPKESGMAALS